jgi:hypothetical protein
MLDADTAAKLSDVLSDRAIALLTNGNDGYRALVVDTGGSETAVPGLASFAPQDLFRKPIRNKDEAASVLAGLWMWHDQLDPAHRIVQDIHTPTGSLWHAIIHRREGDFWNSKYWYNRARTHGSHTEMAATVARVLDQAGSIDRLSQLIDGGSWVPERFVDLVEQAHRNSSDPRREVLARLQVEEWKTVFEHTLRAAV